MGDLLIRNVPDDLKRELTDAARVAGHSLSDEAKRRLQMSAQDKPGAGTTGAEFLQSIQELFADIPDEEREAFAAIMDEIEAERRKDYGRPVTFGE